MLPPSRFALRWASADDVAVMRAPSRTYAALVEQAERGSWGRAMRRPALVLLTLGVASAIAATGRVTASLVASTMLVWCWVIAAQMMAGLALVATARTRRVSVPAAVELFFAGHLPWSLWACVIAAWHAADAPFGIEVAGCAALVAMALTIRILVAFSRIVLGAPERDARLRTLAHQAFTWFVVVAFFAATSGGWYRLLQP